MGVIALSQGERTRSVTAPSRPLAYDAVAAP